MKKLLILAHTPSNNTKSLAQALLLGAQKNELALTIELLAPLRASAEDLAKADGYLIFTTENFGYMSGALKDLFDRCYYDLIDTKRGTPYALIIRAGKDGTGSKRAVESICQGLGWNKVQNALILQGDFRSEFIEQIKELGEGFALGLADGIF